GGAATYAAVDAGLGGVPVAAAERAFRAFLARNRVFFGLKFGAPLRVALGDFVHILTLKAWVFPSVMLIDFQQANKLHGYLLIFTPMVPRFFLVCGVASCRESPKRLVG